MAKYDRLLSNLRSVKSSIHLMTVVAVAMVINDVMYQSVPASLTIQVVLLGLMCRMVSIIKDPLAILGVLFVCFIPYGTYFCVIYVMLEVMSYYKKQGISATIFGPKSKAYKFMVGELTRMNNEDAEHQASMKDLFHRMEKEQRSGV